MMGPVYMQCTVPHNLCLDEQQTLPKESHRKITKWFTDINGQALMYPLLYLDEENSNMCV